MKVRRKALPHIHSRPAMGGCRAFENEFSFGGVVAFKEKC